MKLVWQQTGDSIEFLPANTELAELYITECNQKNQNSFCCYEKNIHPIMGEVNIENMLTEINNALQIVVPILNKFNINDLNFNLINFDQNQLNLLHRRWVQLQLKHSNITKLLSKIDTKAADAFFKLNELTHNIESYFRINLYSKNFIPIINNLGTDILNFNKSNIIIDFNNLGRTTFDKWLHYDNEVFLNDTNNFLELHGKIKINLERTYKNNPPTEYIKWCQSYDLPPIGNLLNFGNFVDLEENLFRYRELFVKNFKDSSNTLKFEL